MNNYQLLLQENEFKQMEQEFDSINFTQLNESLEDAFPNMVKALEEAFNSESYPIEEIEERGSGPNYIFLDDKGEKYRIHFVGTSSAYGRGTEKVYIGKAKGKIFTDSIDKLSNPRKLVATFIDVFHQHILGRGKAVNGFVISLSGKAAPRLAPFLKKVIDKALRTKLGVVDEYYNILPNRVMIWTYDSTKSPEQVFTGKKITDEAPWLSNRDSGKPQATENKRPVADKPHEDVKRQFQIIDKELKNELKSRRSAGVKFEILGVKNVNGLYDSYSIQVDFGLGHKARYDLEVKELEGSEYNKSLKSLADNIVAEKKRIAQVAKEQKERLSQKPEEKEGHTSTGKVPEKKEVEAPIATPKGSDLVSGESPKANKQTKDGKIAPDKLNTLPDYVRELVPLGLKGLTKGVTNSNASPDLSAYNYTSSMYEGHVNYEKDKLVGMSIDDKKYTDLATYLNFSDMPTLDPKQVIKAVNDKSKVIVCTRCPQRDLMAAIVNKPKNGVTFKSVSSFVETYIGKKLNEAGIVSFKVTGSGRGQDVATVAIQGNNKSSYYHLEFKRGITDKITTNIRCASESIDVKIPHPDKIYNSVSEAHNDLFVSAVNKLIDVIKNGEKPEDEKPDISETVTVEQAIKSRDPSILGAKGIWMDGVTLNESVANVGYTFRWGMPKTGELATFVSKGFVRNGKGLNCETPKGVKVIFKVAGVDPKVTPADFVKKGSGFNYPVITAKEFLAMLREYPAFSTLLEGGDVYGGGDNGEYNYELETLYGPSTIDIKLVGNELQAIMKDDEGSVMGRAKHTNTSNLKVAMDSVISSLDNTVEEFFGDTFDAVYQDTKIQKGEKDKFGFKIPSSTLNVKKNTGIGDLVRLKSPKNGVMYASIQGFNLGKNSTLINVGNNGKLSVGSSGSIPAPGSKVTSYKAKLKATPLNTSDYQGETQLLKDDFLTVKDYIELEEWLELNPGYQSKMKSFGL